MSTNDKIHGIAKTYYLSTYLYTCCRLNHPFDYNDFEDWLYQYKDAYGEELTRNEISEILYIVERVKPILDRDIERFISERV